MANEKYAFVMMIRSVWWNEFRHRHDSDGKQTHSYIQAGRGSPTKASMLFFYVVKPVGEVAGHAEFIERKAGDANEIWQEHGRESVLTSKAQCDNFVNGRKKIAFIRFQNLREAAKPIPLKSLLMLLGKKKLARRGFYINKKTADRMITIMG